MTLPNLHVEVQDLNEQMRREEMEECTFRPQVVSLKYSQVSYVVSLS